VAEFQVVEKSVGSGADGQSSKTTRFMTPCTTNLPVCALHFASLSANTDHRDFRYIRRGSSYKATVCVG
jgi:hypothetical protein